MEIVYGAGTLAEVVPALDRIFHKKFRRLLPKIYQHAEYAADHYVCREGGKLLGTLASLPEVLHVGTAQLQARGIGMVGVCKQARGRGVMDAMMRRAVEDARQAGVDFMFLSGIRQRYERYGFVPCGATYVFEVTKQNFKYYKPKRAYTFSRLRDAALVPKLEEIYNSRPVRYERKYFADTLRSWNNTVCYTVQDGERIAGYLCVAGNRICELCLTDADVLDVLYGYRAFSGARALRVELFAGEETAMRRLSTIAQSYTSQSHTEFAVLDFGRVLTALLEREEMAGSCAFSLVMQIGEERLHISRGANGISVVPSEQEAELVLTREEATAALFTPHLAQAYGLPFSLSLPMPHLDAV